VLFELSIRLEALVYVMLRFKVLERGSVDGSVVHFRNSFSLVVNVRRGNLVQAVEPAL